MLFSFIVGEGSICSGTVLDYVPKGWVGELCMVCDAHLFVLQIHASSFGTGWWGEVVQRREAFNGLGVEIAEFDPH
jgi:hypothetical protein